jgi:hypothetical protein
MYEKRLINELFQNIEESLLLLYGMILCIARQGIHINRKDQQARFIAR